MSRKIPFFKPSLHNNFSVVTVENPSVFSKQTVTFFESYFNTSCFYFTNSGTSALLASLLALRMTNNDEVIIPSFSFVGLANAVVLSGAKPVFADIELPGCNINVNALSSLLTPQTKAVIAIHYAGAPCSITELQSFCKQHDLVLIEDAAQAIGSSFGGKHLGVFGDMAILSFDYMKNVSTHQGGMLVVNNEKWKEPVEVVLNNGTNKAQFYQGKIPFFEWVALGANLSMPPIATYLLEPQLANLSTINNKRKALWQLYHELLNPLALAGSFILPTPLSNHNAHIFYLILPDSATTHSLNSFLNSKNIVSQTHYAALHLSQFASAREFASAALPNFERLNNRLLRLPLWNEMSSEEVMLVVENVKAFFKENKAVL
jgi:dTDP-4-amino-4,6-dideoxygalactose transaminase